MRWTVFYDGCSSPHPLSFTPLTLLFPLVGAGPSELLLMSRIWKKGWDVTSVIMLQKPAVSVRISLPLWLWWSKLRGPHGIELSSDSIQKARKELSPSNQQPMRNWILPTTCELGSGSVPSLPLRWEHSPSQRFDCSPWPTLKHRTQLARSVFLTHSNCEIVNPYHTKWLSFGVISYTEIDN